jgi:hypothetical protein
LVHGDGRPILAVHKALRSRDPFSLRVEVGSVAPVVGDPGGISGRIGCALHRMLRNLPRCCIDGERSKRDQDRGAEPGDDRYRAPFIVPEPVKPKRQRARKPHLSTVRQIT